jgi:hypothetical protein
MELCGEGGVLKQFLGLSRLGYGNSLGEGRDFSRFVRFDVDDGSMIRSWQHVWCGDQTLKVAFPNFFTISPCKKALVANLLQFSNTFQWNITFYHICA